MVNLHGHTKLFVRGAARRTAKGHATNKRRIESTAATTTTTSIQATMSFPGISRNKNNSNNDDDDNFIPPDPSSLLTDGQLDEQVERLASWFGSNRRNQRDNFGGGGGILCLTGAGLSTESGIPDYRGHDGSYHRGHKPMIHQQFMDSTYQRKRYWGRSLIGWSKFDQSQPNKGHHALAELERRGYIGVNMEDRQEFYDEYDKDEFLFTSGQRSLSVVTQNVDSLHQRAGSNNVIHLHGRGKDLKCMNCGTKMDRNDFHEQLERTNKDWLDEVLSETINAASDSDIPAGQQQEQQQRPDGDANVNADFNHVHVPACPHCGVGFWKPDVVFFGDSVPRNRVALCQHGVENSDGLLIIGTSLAVHSAFRHVRAAHEMGKPIAILNVGETRAEAEGLSNIVKIESPIGETLKRLVHRLWEQDSNR